MGRFLFVFLYKFLIKTMKSFVSRHDSNSGEAAATNINYHKGSEPLIQQFGALLSYPSYIISP